LQFVHFASKVIFGAIGTITTGQQAVKWGLAELGAAVDLVISLTSVAPVAYHFTELSDTPHNNFRSLAIMDETVRLTGYVSNIAGDIAKFDPDPVTSTVAAVASSVLAFIDGGLQYAESFSE
jgi:hypothetical protein